MLPLFVRLRSRPPNLAAACFSINGIDIDLDELERFEARLRQKRAVVEEAVNGLESRLGQLELRLDADEEEQEDKSEAHAADDRDDLDELYEEIQRKNESESAVARSENPPSLGALLVAFLSLLAFLNQICFVQRNQQLMES